jgi:HPt (histidine-containing phosphotransfer) domain-containing protein
MNAPVDLTNLRSMTDGDREMEKALFEEFFSSFEAGIASLQANIGAAAAEAWRKEAHALKGIALNLGAMELGELCKKGQDEPGADVTAKEALLKTIQAEYDKVRQFLLTLI